MRIACVPGTVNCVPVMIGGHIFDYGYMKPVKELGRQGHEIKFFLPRRPENMRRLSPNAEMLEEFSNHEFFELYGNLDHSVESFLKTRCSGYKERFYGQDDIPIGGAFSMALMCGGNDLGEKLNDYDPDAVLSCCSLGSYDGNAERVWICHDYYPMSLVEMLQDDEQAADESLDVAIPIMDRFLGGFDYVATPSITDLATIKKHHNVQTLLLTLHTLDPPTTEIGYQNERGYALMGGFGGWFRYRDAQNELLSLAKEFDRGGDEYKIYVYGRSKADLSGKSVYYHFDPIGFRSEIVGVGLCPNRYYSGYATKVLDYQRYGIPALVHPTLIESFVNEPAVFAYSVENVMRFLEGDYRRKHQDEIIRKHDALHGLENTTQELARLLRRIVDSV